MRPSAAGFRDHIVLLRYVIKQFKPSCIQSHAAQRWQLRCLSDAPLIEFWPALWACVHLRHSRPSSVLGVLWQMETRPVRSLMIPADVVCTGSSLSGCCCCSISAFSRSEQQGQTRTDTEARKPSSAFWRTGMLGPALTRRPRCRAVKAPSACAQREPGQQQQQQQQQHQQLASWLCLSEPATLRQNRAGLLFCSLSSPSPRAIR
ncbi:hypothetical protein FKP32DRAFT_326644 [Trametes sanguinea]|nr:hypothetical protein FKP32DRAFT_326644 [Trametes sanguinea]